MKAEIITVGSEILIGDIIDTNSNYISRELANIGISIFFHTTVGDNKERLFETIKKAISRSDLIILTGGLGPTEDDITKEIVAKAISKNLVESKMIKIDIEKKLKAKGYTMSENNLKQCLIFENSKIFENENGTAPGIAVKIDNDKTIVLLPGPPNELTAMFEKSIKYYLKNLTTNSVIKSKNIHLYNIAEYKVDEQISELLNQKNPSVGIYAEPGEVRLRITAYSKNEVDCDQAINEVFKQIEQRLKNYIYGIDVKNMQTALVRQAIENKKQIAVAESCTGGLIASRIVSVSGASECFKYGIICYSNEAKINLLNIDKFLIKKFGAVSKETAYEMALNVRKIANADIGISTTGIAGPCKNNKLNEPVGLVFVGISTSKKTTVKKLNIPNSGSNVRQNIRHLATLFAMNEARIATTQQ